MIIVNLAAFEGLCDATFELVDDTMKESHKALKPFGYEDGVIRAIQLSALTRALMGSLLAGRHLKGEFQGVQNPFKDVGAMRAVSEDVTKMLGMLLENIDRESEYKVMIVRKEKSNA